MSKALTRGRESLGEFENYGERLYVEGLLEIDRRRREVRSPRSLAVWDVLVCYAVMYGYGVSHKSALLTLVYALSLQLSASQACLACSNGASIKCL